MVLVDSWALPTVEQAAYLLTKLFILVQKCYIISCFRDAGFELINSTTGKLSAF